MTKYQIHFCASDELVITWQPRAIWQIFTSSLIFLLLKKSKIRETQEV